MIPHPKLRWVLTVTDPLSVSPGKPGVVPMCREYVAESWEDMQVELARWEGIAKNGGWAVAMSLTVECAPILLVIGPGAPPGGTAEKPEPRRWPMPLEQLRELSERGST